MKTRDLFENIGTANGFKTVFDKQKARLPILRKEPTGKRKERLLKIRDWIHANREKIHAAMYADFRKPKVEVDAIELFHVLSEIKTAASRVDDWIRPVKVDAPITMLGSKSVVTYEPKGVCLIIAPWNYPFSLAVGPLVSALVAGNSVILKPSEHTPHVSTLLKRMVDELFTQEEVVVFEGDADVARELLLLPFDHIFFTGSPEIGKLVMRAAAENLSSITLELGGKCPAVITADANINDAAERIAVGKFVNNGQTCVAPDYVLVEQSVAEKFTQRLIKKVEERFIGDTTSLKDSPHYGRIVNNHHFKRLTTLLEDAVEKGATIAKDGLNDASERFFHPVVLSNVPSNARLLEEEIFGPILPIVTFVNVQEAINIINEKPKPLALYIFSSKTSVQNKILRETSSGGVCVNDCGIHFLHSGLPFGGVNHSGIGKSHGHYGFLAFSNEKPVLKQKSGMTSAKTFYPPYTKITTKLVDWFLKLF